jgi:hypothetical protein
MPQSANEFFQEVSAIIISNISSCRPISLHSHIASLLSLQSFTVKPDTTTKPDTLPDRFSAMFFCIKLHMLSLAHILALFRLFNSEVALEKKEQGLPSECHM